MVKDLTTGSPAKLILMFTLPLIVGNVFQQLYLLSDTLIVGRLLGVSALAAVGCSGCLMFFMIGFVIGFTAGLSICTGQRFGAKDEEGMKKSAAACVVLSAITTVIVTIFGVIMVRPALIFLQTPPEVLDMACTFLTVIFLGIVATMMFNMSSNLIRALGDSKTPLYFLILGCVLNIILEVVFIGVFNWGIQGAGFATVLAQLINGGCCVYYIKKKIPLLHFELKDLKISREIAIQHLKVALPMGFQASIIAIGAIILQVPLNNLGEVAVAAYAAAQKIDMIAVMPLMSFGMAMAAYTAQNYGAGRMDRIKTGVNKCILMSGGFSILAGMMNICLDKAIYAREGLTRKNSREPTLMEIAQEIGISKEEITYALDAIQSPVSLYEPIFTDGGDPLYVMDQIKDKKSSEESWVEEISLREAMDRLPKRERHIIDLVFSRERPRQKWQKKSISARHRCQGWRKMR